MENAAIPVIETWDLPETPIGHVVGFSNAAAVKGLVDHFVAKGLTRIAFIGGDADRDTRGTDRDHLASVKMHLRPGRVAGVADGHELIMVRHQ